jgi:hypothetical protein
LPERVLNQEFGPGEIAFHVAQFGLHLHGPDAKG